VTQAVSIHVRAVPWLRRFVYMSGSYHGSGGLCTCRGLTVAQAVCVHVVAVPWLRRFVYMSGLYRGSGGLRTTCHGCAMTEAVSTKHK
jgi:hypothetical protein